MYFFTSASWSLIAIFLSGSALARPPVPPPPPPPPSPPPAPPSTHAETPNHNNTPTTAAASAVDALHSLQALASQSFQTRLNKDLADVDPGRHTSSAGGGGGGAAGACNPRHVQKRRDWAHLSTTQKKNYISALQCLLTTPSRSDPHLYPGAKNRYDDFVVVHINQTGSIHGTGNFLTWHRYFTWAYEQALRDECGYEGYAPYWNWFTHTDDFSASPVFDGSDTSLSGDGAYFPHNGSEPVAKLYLPSGSGGGCVASGPLVNMTVNLGPWFPTMSGLDPDHQPAGEFDYNPHCLRRDLLSSATAEYFTAANLLNLTVGRASESISSFQSELQGRFADGFLGMHTTGHVSVGGDASSIFSSVVDPSFFLHHAMIDHVYWLWQMLHPEQAHTIGGTLTILNSPPSRDAWLNDTVYLSDNLAPPQEIQRLVSTTGGPFCYVYV